MKVQSSVKTMCQKCKVIIRSKQGKSSRIGSKRRVFIVCENPKHKQRQG